MYVSSSQVLLKVWLLGQTIEVAWGNRKATPGSISSKSHREGSSDLIPWQDEPQGARKQEDGLGLLGGDCSSSLRVARGAGLG